MKHKLLGPKIQIQNISLRRLTNNVGLEYENKFVGRSQDVLSMVLQDFDFSSSFSLSLFLSCFLREKIKPNAK
jgi:hypothetical protein